jgi:3'-phosphoadenosine 5'-phosphosulfate sulfotransferase (PAPS reductase)/FAD synthetase
MTRVLSLGGGVQSSAMLLMALEGVFGDRPDFAIFADTQWESRLTYDWLDKLEKEVAPFEIRRVTAGNIREDQINACKPGADHRAASMPFALANGGRAHQQCSEEYKIRPFRRYLRSIGIHYAEVWIGISTDEAHPNEAIRIALGRQSMATNRKSIGQAVLSRLSRVADEGSRSEVRMYRLPMAQ